ncbi:glycerophosphodiester phosphodiesterase [Sphingomonas soli]|uniref:glycerophosphodiester phosphodiesterase n=1 Tax=Sphingomonas soli TaxID=266127 RepID=UPI00082CA68A|nr:glycerophosphodiester phosphodiesterase [Sphingomonas soli]
MAAWLTAGGCATTAEHGTETAPLIIAHRGASGERPEHTLMAYELAIKQGADYIEPDLVPTKDGHLVVRHENNIVETTDIAQHPEFAARRTTKTIDGIKETGWFTEDFTLAELKTLRAVERLPLMRPANTKYNGQAEIPTIEEVIALAKRASAETGRVIGIYPETKHPTYFASLGLPVEPRLLAAIEAAGWNRADAPVFIQSFEVNNLKALAKQTKVRLIQLIKPATAPADGSYAAYRDMIAPAALRDIADYAYGIGPELTLVLDPDNKPTTLITDAHAAGLRVHPWTFRAESAFLNTAYRTGTNPMEHGRLLEEMQYFLGLGVDGFFTDYPYIGAQARASFRTPAK